MARNTPYELILKGGLVFDPASSLKGSYDVAFSHGRVAAIDPSIDPCLAENIQDVSGQMVVPGVVDIHTHCCDGIGGSTHPDLIGIGRGSTTIVDGGSTGAATFGAFRRVIAESQTRVLVWLALSSIGQADTAVGESLMLPWLNVERAVQMAQEHPQTIIGFKGRLSTYVTGGSCIPSLKLLLEAGHTAGLPVQVHVGDTGETLGQILDMMRPGDVVSHYLTGRRHGILGPAPIAGAKIIPEAFEARQRGVIFDVAQGSMHVCFPAMQATIEAGLLPDTISTDLTKRTASWDPYFSVSMIATQFMSYGVPVEQLIPMMTVNPARAIRRPELGVLQAGGIGDATILKIEEGSFTLTDVDGRTRRTDRRIVATGVVKAGLYTQTLPV